jgi:hypothetical protein
MAKTRKNNAKRKHRVGDAAFLPRRHLPAAPAGRQTAGFFSIKRWRGRLTRLPAELQQIFMPLAEPHLPLIQKGEVRKCFISCPQVGVLILELRDGEIWATFVDAHQWACLGLQFRRRYVLALRYRTFARNPEGGMWVWLPQQPVFPTDCRLTLPCAEYQANFLGKSPPLWWQPTVRRLETTDEAQSQKKTSRWLTPSVPCAQRSPSALPIGAGAVGWV